MLTGGADKTARLYDLASETVTATMKGHKKKVSSVILHPTADVAVTGSADKTVCIWEASTGKKQHTLKVRTARFVFCCCDLFIYFVPYGPPLSFHLFAPIIPPPCLPAALLHATPFLRGRGRSKSICHH